MQDFEQIKNKLLLASQISDLAQVNRLVSDLVHIMPVPIVQASPPFVARARMNYGGEVFKCQAEVSYNPFPERIKLARANFDGQQVFYAAVPSESDMGSCQNTATMETVWEHVKDEDLHMQYMTFSRWYVSQPLQVVMLSFSEKSYKQNKDFERAHHHFLPFFEKNIANLSPERKDFCVKALNFMSSVFCQHLSKSLYYRISASYFNVVMMYSTPDGVPIDGLIYPSANTGAAGMNIVLRKELIDDKVLVCDYAAMMTMQRNPSDPKNIHFRPASDTVVPDQKGNFRFPAIW